MPSTHDKLLAEFPDTTYQAWRQQVDKDLKGGDFQKRLVTKLLDGFDVQPLYAPKAGAAGADAAGFAGLPPYRRGAVAVGRHGARWDIRTLHDQSDLAQLKADLAADLGRGARSLWLRFDATVRFGLDQDAARTGAKLDGIPCSSAQQLEQVLAGVDLAAVPLMLDAGGNAPALAAMAFSVARKRGIPLTSLQGSLACDPLGAVARDGTLPHSIDVARALSVELVRFVAEHAPALRSMVVSTSPYHDAGASSAQEIAYALSTGVGYLRWLTQAGVDVATAARQIGFTYSIGGDLFLELAKLRAARLCWSKLVAACGGDAAAQNTTLHAITSRRTKTVRDPWVNMLRTTTEAFSAMAGGADSLTTRGFDEALGPSEAFARRIARNVQVVLNEEAHVTRVADPAGGSYYLEALTDELARTAWAAFQQIEAQGGMQQALISGAVAKQIAEVADKRNAAVRRRTAPVLGVSEYANLAEEPVVRVAADQAKLRAEQVAEVTRLRAAHPQAAAVAPLVKARAAGHGVLQAAIDAAAAGASIGALSAALGAGAAPIYIEPLPVRSNAELYEALRTRCDAHTAKTGKRPTAFLCNLGAIPQHKARSAFSTGFMNAGGVGVVDNDGFGVAQAAVEAFAASGATLAVICGTDDQYPQWVPELVPLLRQRGAREVVLAGRPGDHEAAFKQAGVGSFIFVGSDVVATLSTLLDRIGVAS
ncbi:MAG TPA: methylmalonyl-CoA mutase subunit beta [Polyangiales bacterium]